MGRTRESLIAYRMVTRLEPENFEAWLDYGDTLFELGYPKQALKALDKSTTLNDGYADVHYSRARVLYALKRHAAAAAALRQARGFEPERPRQFLREFPDAVSRQEFRDLLEL